MTCSWACIKEGKASPHTDKVPVQAYYMKLALEFLALCIGT